jgi:radical SAM-linked protein
MSARRTPDREAVLPVQRLRIRYAKRGPLRFSSHRDFQRALERALRRTAVPMAYSAGFSPHPRVSYANAAPTGAASEAEYVEIAVIQRCDPETLRIALDEALPPGLDIVDIVEARSSDLVARLEASMWRIEIPQCSPQELEAAWRAIVESEFVLVERVMKQGPRTLDLRPALLGGHVEAAAGPGAWTSLTLIVANVTPTVRPDEILTALRTIGGLAAHAPARATRLAQGPLQADGSVGDPLAADRAIGALPA